MVRRSAAVAGSADRFDWWDEGRQKWGWWSNSTAAGASITLQIPTSSAASVARAIGSDDSSVLLAFGCTRSGTKPMGNAQVSCVSGCRCKPQTFEGSWDQQNSLTSLMAFRVSQHPECQVQFKVRCSKRSAQFAHNASCATNSG